jgi:hypothetical protein
MNAGTDAATRYFSSIAAALNGLEVFLRDDRSPLYRHDIVASVVAEYIARLEKSFSCWRNRLGFQASFRISRAESGFPVFQNVLELENDRKQAEARLATIPQANELRQEMADFILRNKEFPEALQRSMAERLYLEDVESKETFGPFTLAQTVKVSVNPKSGLPYYLVHWASFDGTPACRQGPQAERQGGNPPARRRIAQPRTGASVRRFHRTQLGLLAVADHHCQQSRQGLRDAAP